jgi:hypothetical protein
MVIENGRNVLSGERIRGVTDEETSLTEVDRTMVNHDVRGIVVHNGRNVLSGESIRGVTDEETSFTDSSVTVNGRWGRHGFSVANISI